MNFNEATYIARKLMDEYLLQDWIIAESHAKRRFGCCWYKSKKITISRPLTELNNENHVRDVILHEIAHALAGPDAKHGPKWRAIAARIGATPSPYYSKEVIKPEKCWHGFCPTCKKVVARRDRKPTLNHSCNECSGRKYNVQHKIIWKRNTKPTKRT